MMHGTDAGNSVQDRPATGVNEEEQAEAPERSDNFQHAANNRHGTAAQTSPPPTRSEVDTPSDVGEQPASVHQVTTLPHRLRSSPVVPFSGAAVASSSTAPVAPPPVPSDEEIIATVDTAVQATAADAQQGLEAMGVHDAPMPQPGETTQSYGQRVDTYIEKLKAKFPHVNNAYQIILRNMTTVPLQVMAREGLVNLSIGHSVEWDEDTRKNLALLATVSPMVLTAAVMVHDRVKHRQSYVTEASNVTAMAGLIAVTAKAASEKVIGNVVEALGKTYYITILRDITAVFHTVSSNTNSPHGMMRCLAQLGMLFLVYMGTQAAMSSIQGFATSHSGTNTDFDPQSSREKALAYGLYALTVTLPEIAFDLVDGYTDAALFGAGNDPSNRAKGWQDMKDYRVDAKWVLNKPDTSIGQRIFKRFEAEMTARLQTLTTLYPLDAVINADAKTARATARATQGAVLGWESLFLGLAGSLFFKGRIDYDIRPATTDEEHAADSGDAQNTAVPPQLPPVPPVQITAPPGNEQVQAEAAADVQLQAATPPQVQPSATTGSQVQQPSLVQADVRTLYRICIDATTAVEAAQMLKPGATQEDLNQIEMTMLRHAPEDPAAVRTLSTTSGGESRAVTPDPQVATDRPEASSSRFTAYQPPADA